MRFFYEGFPAHCYVVVVSECLWEGFCIIFINQSGQFKSGSATKRVVESRFLEPSVSRSSRYLEQNFVSLGFTSLELYNFTPDFSNTRFLGTPDNSNQFFFLWDKLTLDNSNLRKFRNNLVRMSITSTPLNKLTLPDKLFSHILSHNNQATNLSSV